MNLVTPRAAEHVTKLVIVADMILVTLCCSSLVGLKCSTNLPLTLNSFKLQIIFGSTYVALQACLFYF
jgi:hypothetical protein